MKYNNKLIFLSFLLLVYSKIAYSQPEPVNQAAQVNNSTQPVSDNTQPVSDNTQPVSEEEVNTGVKIIIIPQGDINNEVIQRVSSLSVESVSKIHSDRSVLSENDPGIIQNIASNSDTASLAEIGKTLNVAYLINLFLSQQQDGYHISIIVIDVINIQNLSSAAFVLPVDQSAWEQIIQTSLAPISRSIPLLNPTTGSLVITTNPRVDGIILLDGQQITKIPTWPITNITPGRYNLEIQAEGYNNYQKEIEIIAGQETNEEIELVRFIPPPPPAPVVQQNQWYKNIWLWVGIGAGAVLIAGAITAGVLLSEDETQEVEWGVPFPEY